MFCIVVVGFGDFGLGCVSEVFCDIVVIEFGIGGCEGVD